MFKNIVFVVLGIFSVGLIGNAVACDDVCLSSSRCYQCLKENMTSMFITLFLPQNIGKSTLMAVVELGKNWAIKFILKSAMKTYLISLKPPYKVFVPF